jgi:hypothetical protein
MIDRPVGAMTTDELVTTMRSYPAGDLFHNELRAELDRRVALAQISASSAQIKSAWFQFAAVVAMFMTTALSAFFQWWLAPD